MIASVRNMINQLIRKLMLQFLPPRCALSSLAVPYNQVMQPQGRKAKVIARTHNKMARFLCIQRQIPLLSQSSVHCSVDMKYLGSNCSSISFESNQSLKYLRCASNIRSDIPMIPKKQGLKTHVSRVSCL